MRIRVLHFRGCPNRDETLDRVRGVARALGMDTPIESVEVRSENEAMGLGFLGSPTVQIDGVDAEPAARDRTDFGFVCRLYGGSGVPPAEMIAAAILEATA